MERIQVAGRAKVLVLWWRYMDGSGAGILRVYGDEERACEDLALLKTTSDGRVYFVEPADFIGSSLWESEAPV